MKDNTAIWTNTLNAQDEKSIPHCSQWKKFSLPPTLVKKKIIRFHFISGARSLIFPTGNKILIFFTCISHRHHNGTAPLKSVKHVLTKSEQGIFYRLIPMREEIDRWIGHRTMTLCLAYTRKAQKTTHIIIKEFAFAAEVLPHTHSTVFTCLLNLNIFRTK